VSGVDVPVVEEPRRAGDPASIVARADRVREVLGWRPAHADLGEIVGAALAWERYLTTRNR
jgi:UDP-glucose 4-epimerase